MAAEKKPWQTKEWKARRDALIGDHCSKCGTTEGPMVLQHTWHARSLKAIEATIRHTYRKKYAAEFGWPPRTPRPEPDSVGDQYECPDCGRQVRWIKSRARFEGVGRCDYRGTTATPRRVVSSQAMDDYSNAVAAALADFEAQVEAKYGKQIHAEAEGIRKVELARYMSCKDTVTMCRSCAFKADKAAGFVKYNKTMAKRDAAYHGYDFDEDHWEDFV